MLNWIYALRVDLKASDNASYVANYQKFSIYSEADNYTLHVDGYVGDAG